MTSGAAALAVATIETTMTADVATTLLTVEGEETMGAPATWWDDAAAAVTIWLSWSGITGMAMAAGLAGRLTMTVSCEKPWRGRSWASSKGHAAGSAWIVKATAWIGIGHHVGHHHFL